MAKQNIYDNETFFEGYKGIRENEGNANVVFEIPALMSLLPSLSGTRVLDLGCGFGEHCKKFVEMGASCVIGVDISERMLEIAHNENADSRITYLNAAMEDIDDVLGSEEKGKFDVVVSSLALHYVQDFDGVINNIYSFLKPGGYLVFSQENPLNTCHSGGDRWTRDENGRKMFLNLSNYSVECEYESTWFIDGVKRYHRMFSTIVNTLVDAGFVIERFVEPLPTPEILEKFPQHKDLRHKPDFLLVKARKVE